MMRKSKMSDGRAENSLIIIDCSMPLMNGYEATEKIRRYLKVKGIMQPMIVACTGHTEDLYIKKAWRTQMDELAPKPIDTSLLKAIIEEYVNIQ